jgi:RNA polymerase sigma-70 factor (ECF subfamily)
MSTSAEPDILIEHLFRRQSGRMVAHLTRLLGPSGLDVAEEAVQEAMLRALQGWPHQGTPPNPEAWLFRVAHNVAIDRVRRKQMSFGKTEELIDELSRSAGRQPNDPGIPEQLRDDELSMIFMCCHPDISTEAQVALSLKTVGGFSVPEIARAFLLDDTTIAQRLVRAKRQIRKQGVTLERPEGPDMERRLDAVLSVIYFLFNEGYAALAGDDLIRFDLCREALRLGRLVASSLLSSPKVHALVALLALQGARLPARVNDKGDLVLLDDQDRSRWDEAALALGFHHFDLSMTGNEISRYHIEAAIAATHARSARGKATDWPLILQLYDQLLAVDPSPVVALNRAVALGKVHGPAKALEAIEPLQQEPRLRDYYLLLALRGHLLLELGRAADAAMTFRSALECRCSEPERRFLRRKLADCNPGAPSHRVVMPAASPE